MFSPHVMPSSFVVTHWADIISSSLSVSDTRQLKMVAAPRGHNEPALNTDIWCHTPRHVTYVLCMSHMSTHWLEVRIMWPQYWHLICQNLKTHPKWDKYCECRHCIAEPAHSVQENEYTVDIMEIIRTETFLKQIGAVLTQIQYQFEAITYYNQSPWNEWFGNNVDLLTRRRSGLTLTSPVMCSVCREEGSWHLEWSIHEQLLNFRKRIFV